MINVSEILKSGAKLEAKKLTVEEVEKAAERTKMAHKERERDERGSFRFPYFHRPR